MAEAKGASPVSSLDDVLSGDSKPEGDKPSSADEKPSKKEAKDEGSQKFPESESSPPAKKEKKASPQKKVDDKEEEKDDDEPDAKTEDDESQDELPDAEASKDDKEESAKKDEAKDKWDSEENPYVKRFKDTSANWQREHQQNLQMQSALQQMQREMVTLRKIADGTYDPEKDGPQQPTPESIASNALNVGKVLASKNAAISQYGAEKVNTDLAEFNHIFGDTNNPSNKRINDLVLEAESPIHEAFRILERFRFEKKYGSTPVEWHKNIRAEAEKELRETISKEITDKLLDRADKSNNTPRGLHSSRGSNGLKSGSNPKPNKGSTPLKDIVGR